MRFRRLGSVLFLLSAAAWSIGQADERLARVEAAVAAYMAEKKVTGASVAIASRGQIVFQKGFGLSDVENDVSAKADTVYRLASVSKTMTSIGVLQLVEAGKLSLDADIRTYVPEFPDKGETVTIRQVLTHTSGIRHYKPNEAENVATLKSVVDSFGRFKDDPLVHKPGERFTYSTYAFNLLARAIETASGLSFGDYLRKHLWGPAGTLASGLEDQRAIVKNRTRGYERLAGGTLLNSSYADISYKWAGGGMVSTAPDLCRVGIALLADRLMKRPTRDLMWTRQKLSSGEDLNQSLGWGYGTFRGKAVASHTGAQQASRTFLAIYPDDELVIVCLTNYESHRPQDLGVAVRNAWYGTGDPGKSRP